MASIILTAVLIALSLCLFHFARSGVSTGWVWAFRIHGFSRGDDTLAFWCGIALYSAAGLGALGCAIYVATRAMIGPPVLVGVRQNWIPLALLAGGVTWLVLLAIFMVPHMRQAVLHEEGPLVPVAEHMKIRSSPFSKLFRGE